MDKDRQAEPGLSKHQHSLFISSGDLQEKTLGAIQWLLHLVLTQRSPFPRVSSRPQTQGPVLIFMVDLIHPLRQRGAYSLQLFSSDLSVQILKKVK